MPERFYDAEFTARVVRLLQLKGGRAPSEVSDEIVPVLDLSSLFTRAASELPGGLFNERDAAAALGRTYSRYYGPNIAAVAGSVHVSQFLNPIGSGRRVAILEVAHFGVANALIHVRFSTAAFVAATLSARTPLNVKPSGDAAVLQFRFESRLQAGFPPAGISPVVTLSITTASNNVIRSGIVVLEPGEGLIIHSGETPSVADADPLPNTFAVAVAMVHQEFLIE